VKTAPAKEKTAMTITVELPDALEALLFVNGQEPARAVLEAVALEGYRAERLTESDVRQLLGFETRMEVHEFLKEHAAFMHYTLEDLDHDTAVALEVAGRGRSQRQTASERPAE
jgi:hypothetical protein